MIDRSAARGGMTLMTRIHGSGLGHKQGKKNCQISQMNEMWKKGKSNYFHLFFGFRFFFFFFFFKFFFFTVSSYSSLNVQHDLHNAGWPQVPQNALKSARAPFSMNSPKLFKPNSAIWGHVPRKSLPLVLCQEMEFSPDLLFIFFFFFLSLVFLCFKAVN